MRKYAILIFNLLCVYLLALGFIYIAVPASAYHDQNHHHAHIKSGNDQSNLLGSITDYNRVIIEQKPYNVEVCKNVVVSGDKTADTVTGAIIGGIIGNNIKGENNGGAIGAIIGGMLGNANSDARAGTKRVCSTETRYRESEKTIYSYSTISLVYEGINYTVKFIKK